MIIVGNASFVKFVYPFTFYAGRYRARSEAIHTQKWSVNGKLEQVWCLDKFPEDDLLPHVSNFLNAGGSTFPTAHIWTLIDKIHQSPNGGIGTGGHHSPVSWDLHYSHSSIEFCFQSIQLIMFCYGVGFVVLGAAPVLPSGQVDEWQDFVHYFRFARGQRGVGLSARRRIGIQPETQEPQYSPYFPESAGGIEAHPDGTGFLDDLISALLKTASLNDVEPVWWEDVYVPGQLLPFTSTYVEQVEAPVIPDLVYGLRNFFSAGKDSHPAPERLSLEHELLLPYSRDQWFFFSLEGGGFIALNPPQSDFFRAQLPAHLGSQYFLLFLLALQQRFTLISLLNQVATSWLTERPEKSARKESFDHIRNMLFDFTARGYFAQAMQGENHHRSYRRWQEIFQVERLYDEVSTEIRHMHEFLESERARLSQARDESLNRLLNIIAWVLGVPTIVLTVIEVWVTAGALPTMLGGTFGLMVGLVLYLILHKTRDRRGD